MFPSLDAFTQVYNMYIRTYMFSPIQIHTYHAYSRKFSMGINFAFFVDYIQKYLPQNSIT